MRLSRLWAAMDASPAAHAAHVLGAARRVLVMTGAGMSADSGLPTYRGVGGLYHDVETEEGVAIEQALSGAMFARRPALTWKYIRQIETACRGARPNAGHAVLARLQNRYERLCVLTQNVDGLHRAAGSRDLIEMHGNIHHLLCTDCDWRAEVADFSQLGYHLPPACPACGGIVRPHVVLFGEMLPLPAVAKYERALADDPDVLLVIGTSAGFPYIVEPVRDAWRRGTPVIEINPEETAISRFCSVTLRAPAASALVAIERRLGA